MRKEIVTNFKEAKERVKQDPNETDRLWCMHVSYANGWGVEANSLLVTEHLQQAARCEHEAAKQQLQRQQQARHCKQIFSGNDGKAEKSGIEASVL